jgi:anti-sigma factor RsiW
LVLHSLQLLERAGLIMSFSDDTLMAYAAGELDAATRRAVEEACARDLSLARRVAQYKMRRSHASGGFGGDDAQHLRPPRQATVVSLDAVRARREASQLAARKAATRERRWSWREWLALTAVLAIGVVAGKFGLSYLQADNARVDMIASHDGTLTAQGRLAIALEQQPAVPPGAAGAATSAAAAAAGAVRIGLSFVAADGSYCRSFASGSGTVELDGLACKTGQEWRVPLLLQNPYQLAAGAAPARARPAGFDMPPPVQDAIERRIAGDPLDAKGEQEAMQRGWQR